MCLEKKLINIKLLEEGKNKLFIFHQKALEDDILTDEEIKISKKIIDESREYLLREMKTREEKLIHTDNIKLNPEQINKLKKLLNKK